MQNNVKYVFTHFVKYVTLDTLPDATGFDVYLKQAAVGVDNLGDPLRFDVFYGLPRSSAPTRDRKSVV